ncbi:hypothetical protein CLV28_1812 [Sediminihabitans luteus]|uniref:Glyoxalase-like domain-containing protein n=1 Tax=Sediminihabitans luteus TaxID=1138585 RepID=A0A2M9CR05_9CELL|nr:VOC family protein [Sediminihabitans luteus]PJJ74317.1 hypothetical protein CLV28_1812 [Sediminihabitans luteus]GII99170.1 hypothetical protein Slu03_15480 [Sediminihabitans luteus]
MARTMQVTFDAKDPEALGRFWCHALGYQVEPPPEGFATWDDALEAWGVPPEGRGDAFAITDPDGVAPRIFLQKVPEPKVAKNRVHLDVSVGGSKDGRPERARALAAELEGHGARVVQETSERDEFWIVMQDPEGNEFCVQ